MRAGRVRAAALLCAALGAATAAADEVGLARFARGDGPLPPPWQIRQLDPRVPPTLYRLRRWDGVTGIEAFADKSMALLARPIAVDLEKTPILCWQWRIDAPVENADMTRKSGDDYAARVYLSFALPGDAMSLATRAGLALARAVYGSQVPDAALNYVWDNHHPVGTLQANAYTDRARMLVLRTGDRLAGAWVRERRDVLADFRRAFGQLAAMPTGLAVAADTDNTGGTAHAGFADFRFVGRADDCPPPDR